MQNHKFLKILFVINPVSGGKNKQDWESAIKDYFKSEQHISEFYLLTGKNDKPSILHYIERFSPDRVIAVGGDGTVKMIAEILQETEMALGILPAGSANGMAKELKIPLNVQQALDLITNGECKRLDLIKINDEEICFHLSDAGLNALLVKHFESSKRRGMWGYAKVILKTMWHKSLLYATIKTDAEEIKRKAYMVVIANAQTYGTGAVINPIGILNDGVFEIIIVKKLSLIELFKMLVTHRPFHAECIEVLQTKNLEMQLKSKAYFQVDGEYLGRKLFIKATILPSSLKVVVPADNQLA